MSETKHIIAQNITRLRQSAGMTQKELASQLTYSDKAVSKWERGESTPDIGTLVAMAELFDVSLDLLVRGKEPTVPAVAPAAPEPTAPTAKPLDPAAQKRLDIRHGVITLIVILLVWAAAGVTFLMFYSLAPTLPHYWLCFLYAVPVSLVLFVIFNTLWFIPRRNFAIFSSLVWSVLLCIQVHFACYGINVWQVYLAGIPAQIAILLSYNLLKKSA